MSDTIISSPAFESAFWHVFRRVAENGTTHDDDHLGGNATDAHLDEEGGGHGEDGGGHSEFGVHITYDILYHSIVFLTCIYVAGVLSSRVLKMPDLVGEIVAGIVLGPPLLDFVPNAEAWVMLGEMGLVILVLEAGIDIDVSTLQLIGTRGFLIAIVGSILPIGLGIFFAWLVDVGDAKAIISAGAAFGPTSLGIALNILRNGGVLNTPVGQLIISAAVIDDMIALIILSQLEALTSEITVVGVLIPIISALAYLLIGGYIAIWVMPPLLDKYVTGRVDVEHRDMLEFTIMIALLLALMPATHFASASYLMGAFISGLAFCTSHELHSRFVRQFKRLLQWLMRVFFAASIGFQVPITDFGDVTVIWQGLVFSLALFGKLAVGFMVPNFTQSRSFTNLHLRDCLVTGFSMAAEGEFAFVIAVFGVDNDLINKDVYASVVLAVLISTIIPPFALRFTINYYNKKAEEAIKQTVQSEMRRRHDLESTVDEPDREQQLEEGIRNHTVVFLCIQTQSESTWGLMHRLMAKMAKLGLEVIDHRAWSPRGVNTTLVNEIYVKDNLEIEKGQSHDVLKARIKEINDQLEKVINQPDSAKVKVQRWYPGVVEEYSEAVDHDSDKPRKKQKSLNLEQRLLEAATAELERKQAMQTAATQPKSVEEILNEMGKSFRGENEEDKGSGKETEKTSGTEETAEPPAAKRKPRRMRQKMRSTPVVGGGLFNEGESDKESDSGHGDNAFQDFKKASGGASTGRRPSNRSLFNMRPSGHPAELIVNGEVYKIRIDDATLRNLRNGYSGEMLDSRGISVSSQAMSIQQDDVPVVNRLQGYIRNAGPLGKISEDDEGHSETSSDHNHSNHPDNNEEKA